MAVNDTFMLPKRVRTMEQMADLLNAEQAELTQTQRTIEALVSQLSISTATFLLIRHERIFDLQPDMVGDLQTRRARLTAKLRGQGTASAEMICAVAASFAPGARVSVSEHCETYSFQVVYHNLVVFPPVDSICRAIGEIKPAHLSYHLGLDLKHQEAHTSACAAPMLGCTLMIEPYTPLGLDGMAGLSAGVIPIFGLSILIEPTT